MPALISWVCDVDHHVSHDRPDRNDCPASVTINNGQWACCLHGGDRGHTWAPIKPTHIERLRVGYHIAHRSPADEARPG